MPERTNDNDNDTESTMPVGTMLMIGLIPAALIGAGLAVLTVYLCCPEELPGWMR